MKVGELVTGNPQLTSEYLSLVGACTYIFLRAEWNAVTCCNSIEPGYREKVTDSDSRIMAGKISYKLLHLSSLLDESADKAELVTGAGRFINLVQDRRNILLHAYPASIDGKSTLHNPKDQYTFTVNDLEQFLGEANEVASILNNSYHNYLKNI